MLVHIAEQLEAIEVSDSRRISQKVSWRQCCVVVVLSTSLLGTTACRWNPSYPRLAETRAYSKESWPRGLERPDLNNLLRVSKSIYSGSEPRGDKSFSQLRRMGIKTVVSVDGARPSVVPARRHGLRYIHIPIGYDGIGKEAGWAIARLVREADGPFYFHCQHGRHRGPAAAAIACIAAEEADSVKARQVLEIAGTSKAYGGLWRDVERYSLPGPDVELPELVEVAEVSSVASAMAFLDRSFENLQTCRDAGWITPRDHPDLVPSKEALIVREGFHEAGRALDGNAEVELRSWLTDAEETSRTIERLLGTQDLRAVDREFEGLSRSCRRCHSKYRNHRY